MAHPDPWRLDPAPYPVSDDFQTRFQDLDLNGHINNVAFAALFESARVLLNRRIRPWAERPAHERTMVAVVEITYLAEGNFPDPVTITSGVGRIGTSSWTIIQAMFQNGACIAICDSVIVCRTDGAARPLRRAMAAELAKLVVQGHETNVLL